MKKRWEVQQQYIQGILNSKLVDFITSSNQDDSEKKMSLNFAITLIVAITTVLYHSFSYMTENAVDSSLFTSFCFALSTGILTLLLLVVFIYLRGVSIELEYSKFKSNIDFLASICYKLSFVLFPIFLLISLFIYIGLSTEKFHTFIGIVGGVFLFIPYFIMLMLGYNPHSKFNLKIQKKYIIAADILICFFVFVIYQSITNYVPLMLLVTLVLISVTYILTLKEKISFDDIYTFILIVSIFTIFLIAPLLSMALLPQSHIDIQMIDTYAGNESRIYGNLHVFGLNEKVSLSLEKIDSNEGMIEVEAITLEPVNNSISSGTIILSNYLNDGEYFISLNMSNQSSGYYKLSTDTGDNRKQASKVFFLE